MTVTVAEERLGDYRAFMACDAKDGWLSVVERELAGWMLKKYRYWDLDLASDGRRVLAADGLKGTKKSHVSFDVRRQEGAGGRSLRARLIETDVSGATWTTELLAHDHAGQHDWIWLTVTNDRGEFVSVPNLAKGLMGALPLTDGTMQYVPAPQIHRYQDVDDVLDVLRDEARHGLVFVAGTEQGSRSVDRFSREVGGWTKEAYGLAQVIVLDPLATHEFNRRVGVKHEAKAWSVRTYHPGVAFDDPSDGRRHRYLTRATRSRDVPRLLGTIARSHSANRQLPAAVERVRRSFERLENKAIIDALTAPARGLPNRQTLPGLERPQGELPLEVDDIAPDKSTVDRAIPRVEKVPQPQRQSRSAPEPLPFDLDNEPTVTEGAERYLVLIDRVKSILGISSLDEASLLSIAEEATRPHTPPEALDELKSQLDAKQAQIDRLRDERSALESALEDTQATQVDVQDALDKARDTERWLRQKLEEAQAYDDAHAEVPDEWREQIPASFSELVDALEAAADGRVIFTGDPDCALQLDANDLGTSCRAAWEAYVTLREYVRAKDEGAFEGSVDYFVKHPPAGYTTCPSRRHAQGETAITMQQWGHERMLPVPAEVHADERVLMGAHFKLGQIARISPRMHYYDDYVNTGKIYIGYIGRHLTNTHS